MQILKKITFDTFFQLISRFFTTFANFILVFLVAKGFGSFGLGQYNKVFAFIGVFSLFIDFGINAVFLKSKDNMKNIGVLIMLRLLIALTVFVLLQPLLFILPYNSITHTGFSPLEKSYIQLLSIVLFLYAFVHSINAVYQFKQKFNVLMFPNIALGICLIIGGVIGFSVHQLPLFFVATILGQIAYIVIAIYLMKSKFDLTLSFRSFFSFKSIFQGKNALAKELFKKSLPLGTTLFLNVLYVRADTLLLTFFKSTQEVGIYTLAYKFFDFPLNLSFFLMTALYPIFLASHKKNKKEFDDLSKNLARIFLGISLLVTTITFIAAPLLQFIQQDFVASIIPFRILILSYPIFFISNLVLWIIITKNKEKYLPIVYLSSLFINVVLNLIFIPRFGYIAAAWTTVISEGVVLTMLVGILSIRFKKII